MNEHHRRGIVSRVLRNAFFLQSVKNLYRRGERSQEGDKLQFYVYGGFLGEARTSCRVQVKM
jgi:hypothetical protein